jgi:hypothetical protein
VGKLEDRLARLEQALPASPGRSPHREELERRGRIGNLYLEWVRGETEKPELTDPRDREEWEHMETIMSTAKKIALRRAKAKEMYSEADRRYADEEVE